MAASYKHIQLRRGLLNDLNRANPILKDGEPAFATDANILKIGDGITRWLNLPEFVSSRKLDSKKYVLNLPSIESYQTYTVKLPFTGINLENEYLVITQPKNDLQDGLRIDYSYASDNDEISVKFSYIPDVIDGGSNPPTDISNAINNLVLYTICYIVVEYSPVPTTTQPPVPLIGEAYSFGSNQFGQLAIGNNDDKFVPTLIDNVSTWRELSNGNYHTAGITDAYELLTCGYNYYGQLGIGNNKIGENQNKFNKITSVYVEDSNKNQIEYKTNPTFKKISAGANHTSAIDVDGNLYTTGLNSNGCLGHGDNLSRSTFTMVGFGGTGYVPFNYRYGTRVEIIDDKYTFPEATSNYNTSVRFLLNRHGEHKILDIPSSGYSFALLNSGIEDLISYSGEYFVSSGVVSGTARDGTYPFYSGDIYINVSGDYNKVSAYSLDYGYAGGENLFFYNNANGGWTDVSSGQQHTLAIRNSGLYSFGNNTFGQLGAGDRKNISTPSEDLFDEAQVKTLNTEVNGIDEPLSFSIQRGIISIAVEGTFNLNYSCDPFTVDGGSGSESCISRKPIKGRVNNGSIFDITSGYSFVNTENNGTLYIFLADNPLDDNSGILNVKVSTQKTMFEKIAAGNYHSLALDNNGNIWSFGQNDHGQLGHNDIVDRLNPTKIITTKESLEEFNVTAFPENSFLGLRDVFNPNNNESERYVVFGLDAANDPKPYDPDERYIISSGTYTIYNVPSTMPIAILNNGLEDKISYSGTILASSDVTITGTDNDGTYNFYTGDITINVSEEFSSVGFYFYTSDLYQGYYGTAKRMLYYDSVGGKFIDIDAGNNFSIAMTNNNEVYAFGSNEYGQLGLGDTQDRRFPTKIPGTWTEMSAGPNHILLVDEYRNLWGCGNNERGQLGVGDNINRSSLTMLRSDLNWTNPSAGGLHSLVGVYSYYPRQPQNIEVRNADTSFMAGTDEIEVRWNQPESLVDGVKYYIVEQSIEGGEWESLYYAESYDPPQYKIVNDGGDRLERTFRVKAVNSFGESEYSDISEPITATDLVDVNYCDVLFLAHFDGNVEDETQLASFFKDYSKNDYQYETNLSILPVKEEGGKFGSALNPYSPNNVHYVFDNTPSISGDFTIEFFIKPTDTQGSRNLLRIQNTLNIKNVDGRVVVDGYADGILSSDPVLSTNKWSHIAWSRSGVVNSLFVDFKNVSTISESSPSSYDLNTNTDLYFELGLIDEVRISTIFRYNPELSQIDEIGREFGEGNPNEC